MGTEKEEMIKSVVLAVMNKQEEIVRNIAREACASFTRATERKIEAEIEERIRKKQKLSTPTINNEGNKNQFNHEKDVLDCLEDIERAVNDKDLTKAATSISEGKKLVLRRMKLIRLADREGWGTVKEYLSDELASDTEDEKHIAKAIKASTAMKEKKRSKKLSNVKSERKSETYHGRSRHTSHGNGRGRTPITCYSCGSLGHTQWQCFANRKKDNPYGGKHR